MKLLNSKTNSLKSKTLGLAMAAVLIPGMAMASGGHRAGQNLSGRVEVVHEIPGGVVTVGAEWGKRRCDPPPVVVVQQPQPQVIVVERERPRHRDREVTIIRERPARPACEKVVVIEKRGNHGNHYGHGRGHDFNGGDRKHGGNSHYYNDGKQVSYDRKGNDGQYHYYKDANQVSEDRVDGSGTYHYYEDAHQVSIQDNRAGRERNVYVRK